jgi:flagellar protein FlaG
VSPDKVKEAVEDINKKIKQANPLHHTSCSFKYHDDTNRISITVKNADTDEVIREIPPEKALDMLAKAWEMAGLLVDEKR